MTTMKKRETGLATASLVFGIVGFFCNPLYVCNLLALVSYIIIAPNRVIVAQSSGTAHHAIIGFSLTIALTNIHATPTSPAASIAIGVLICIAAISFSVMSIPPCQFEHRSA